MKPIVVPFSIDGLSTLNKKLEQIVNKKADLEKMFVEKSLSYIKKRAIYYIQSSTGGSEWYQVTGTLSTSFEMDVSLKRLFNSCYYSAFVEYGTGIKGENRDGYVSDASGKGNEGWFFFDENEELHFTHGMPAHRYLFNAIQDYTVGNEYKRIFKRCFESIVGGME